MAFRLPSGWTRAEPAPTQGGAPDFIAVHARTDDGFTPNITVGTRAAEASLDQLADDAVAQLTATQTDVVVRRRQPLGHEPAPGLAQELTFTTTLDGHDVAITQQQVLLTLTAPADGEGRVLYVATFTTTTRTVSKLAPDFLAMVRSLRPEPSPHR
ncbi:hypothetical protein [Cellulomonas chitinilytica]|uniref:hypothetical protein n=1 Tax=Cellulomonas chitinilytica TaxID=398759 RepID=UPI0019427D3A|nr:hypothetical protein [Cellulomonas chitinilytica]